MSSKTPELQLSSNAFLDHLDYSGGLTFEDVIKQSEMGVYVQKDTIDKDIINQNSAVVERYHENAAIPFGSAQTFSKTILEAVTAKGVIYNDLVRTGCVQRYPLGTYMAYYSQSNLPESPVTAMDQIYQTGYSNAPQSMEDFKHVAVPMPVQFYDWGISKRILAASQNSTSIFGGFDLQSQTMRQKTTGLIDARERLIWNGNSQIKVNGQPIYGILTHPSVTANAVNITFDRSQPQLFINVILGLLQSIASQDFDMSGIMIYHSANMFEFFNQDYTTQTNIAPAITVKNRLMNIGGILDVKPTAYLNPADKSTWGTTGKIIAIKMVPEVLDVAVESEIALAQYADNPKEARFNMFSIATPRVKNDYYGKYGIVLGNVTITG